MLQAIFPDIPLALLVDGRIHKKRRNRRCRAVDRHGNRGFRIAEIETGIEFFGVVEATDAHTRITHFAINVGPEIGVFAV